MNDTRRKYVRTAKNNLSTALDLIEDTIEYIEITLDEEIESFESFPEKLQASKTYENLEENVNTLEILQEELENAADDLKNMIEMAKQILSKKR